MVKLKTCNSRHPNRIHINELCEFVYNWMGKARGLEWFKNDWYIKINNSTQELHNGKDDVDWIIEGTLIAEDTEGIPKSMEGTVCEATESTGKDEDKFMDVSNIHGGKQDETGDLDSLVTDIPLLDVEWT